MLFDTKTFDLSTANNQTLTDLYGLLDGYSDAGSRSPEQGKIDAKYAGAYEALVGSFNPKQQKWFSLCENEQSETEDLRAAQAFILGFKTALRFALEGMK